LDIATQAQKNAEKAIEGTMSFPRKMFSKYMKFFYGLVFVLCTIVFGVLAGLVMGVVAPFAIPSMVLWNAWKKRKE
jgi:hypothetical protein